MIEKTVQDYLKNELEVEVVAELPEELPEAFVYVEKTGSSEKNLLGGAMIAVQSYARTRYEAARLNERVKEAMRGLIRLDEVCSAKLNTDYNFPDTARKLPRYQAVFDITHY